MKLAWFRPAHPDPRLVLDDAAALIGELRRTHDIDVVTEAGAHDFVWTQFRHPYDLMVYELDNTTAHGFIWPYLLQYGGVLFLRSLALAESRAHALIREGRESDLRAEAGFNGGWPMLRAPLLASRLVVVAHAAAAESLRADYDGARVRVAPTGVNPDVPHVPHVPHDASVQVCLLEGRRPAVARAVERARQNGAAVTLIDPMPPEAALREADVVLACRWPSFGEPHAAALLGMAAGKPVVLLDTETTADWPTVDPQTWQPRAVGTGTPIAVSIDPRDEEHSIMLALMGLASDPALRAALGAAAQRWWRANATLAHAVEAWNGILSEAATLQPPARPPDWPAHLSADGTELAREILADTRATVDFLHRSHS